MRHILIPLDGSAFGEAALPYAAAVAERTSSKLVLLTVVQTWSPHPDIPADMAADIEASSRTWAHAYLAGLAEQMRHRFDIEIEALVLEGEVASTIAGHATAELPELIVMSTHGRTGPSRLFLGSVADRLVRELHCPFLLVRAVRSPSDGDLPVAARVLVPLDGSGLAESALDEVARLFTPSTTTLYLVRIVPPAEFIPVGASMVLPSAAPDLTAARVLLARAYLERIAWKLRATGWHVEYEVTTDWMPAAGVLNRAEAHACDLIAIATRGLGGVQRMLLGSVADKVVRGASRLVLVVNPTVGAFSRVLDDRPAPASEPQGVEGALEGAGRTS